jgi:hypothetical protein
MNLTYKIRKQIDDIRENKKQMASPLEKEPDAPIPEEGLPEEGPPEEKEEKLDPEIKAIVDGVLNSVKQSLIASLQSSPSFKGKNVEEHPVVPEE